MATVDKWTLENVRGDKAKQRTMLDLRLERRNLGAAVKVERVESGHRVTVTFAHVTAPHARAEAARFYALVMDTIGDLGHPATEEPLRIDDDVLFTGCTVEFEGADAYLVACQHFGGDYDAGNAADAMMAVIL